MLKYVIGMLIGVALSAGSRSAIAQTDEATAEALMRASGMWQQLASVAPQVRATFQQLTSRPGVNPSPAETERLSKAIDVAYSADRLRSSAVATMRAITRAEHIAALHRWYASPVGKKVAQLEEVASAEQADPQTVVAQGAAILSAMPAVRRALLDELIVVTKSAETLMQITFDTALAAQRGANSMTPSAPGPSAEELRSAMEAQRPQLLQAFAGLSLASYAKAYAVLPTPELAQYVEFLKSEAGRHITDVGLRAFSAALIDASTVLGQALPGTKDKANI